MTKSAISHVQRDDPAVRVTLWRLAPGTATGWHRHEFDYLVVPVTGGNLTVDDGSARHGFPTEAGASYSREKGVEHDVINETGEEISFVEVELKTRD